MKTGESVQIFTFTTLLTDMAPPTVRPLSVTPPLVSLVGGVVHPSQQRLFHIKTKVQQIASCVVHDTGLQLPRCSAAVSHHSSSRGEIGSWPLLELETGEGNPVHTDRRETAEL